MAKANHNHREVVVKRLVGLKLGYILDAGTGAGNMTKTLSAQLKASIVSIDRNKQVFPDVHRKIDKQKVDFVLCDFASLPFVDAAFACIVCDWTLSTIANWKHYQTLREFRRTLKTNSRLYITDYYPEESPRTKVERLAVEALRLSSSVAELKGSPPYSRLPPTLIIQWLEDMGFHHVKHKSLRLAWKEGLTEYYPGMKHEIAELKNLMLQNAFAHKLEDLRKQLVTHRVTSLNGYLIEASC